MAMFKTSGLSLGDAAHLATLGNLTNREFVRAVYIDLFHHEPDAAGWTYWTFNLDHGQDRTSLVKNFMDSPEYALANPTVAASGGSGTGSGGSNSLFGSGSTGTGDDGDTLIPGVPDMALYIGAAAVAGLFLLRKK